jgi:hypothetical protein
MMLGSFTRLVVRTEVFLGLLALTLGFTSSIQASAAHRTADRCVPGSSASLVTATRTYAVDVRGRAVAYRRPGEIAFARFGRFNANGVPTVLAVLDAVMGAGCRHAWYRVQLPLKLNGVTGYVRGRKVRLRAVSAAGS